MAGPVALRQRAVIVLCLLLYCGVLAAVLAVLVLLAIGRLPAYLLPIPIVAGALAAVGLGRMLRLVLRWWARS